MKPEELIEVAKELVAIDDAKDAHMRRWPDWWLEGQSSFDDAEKKARPANVEWSELCERDTLARLRLIDVARKVVESASKAGASLSESDAT